MSRKKADELRGLAAWMPEKSAPHIYAYSNLLRNGVPEKKARKTIQDELIKAGLATKEDFRGRR